MKVSTPAWSGFWLAPSTQHPSELSADLPLKVFRFLRIFMVLARAHDRLYRCNLPKYHTSHASSVLGVAGPLVRGAAWDQWCCGEGRAHCTRATPSEPVPSITISMSAPTSAFGAAVSGLAAAVPPAEQRPNGLRAYGTVMCKFSAMVSFARGVDKLNCATRPPDALCGAFQLV